MQLSPPAAHRSLLPLTAVRASVAARWGVGVAALASIACLTLLVTCDLRRVAPLGFVPRFDGSAVTIDRVGP